MLPQHECVQTLLRLCDEKQRNIDEEERKGSVSDRSKYLGAGPCVIRILDSCSNEEGIGLTRS